MLVNGYLIMVVMCVPIENSLHSCRSSSLSLSFPIFIMLTFNEIKINKSRLSLPLLFVSNVFDSNVLFVLVEEFVATFVNEQFGAPIECDFFFYLVIIFSNKTGQKKEEEENEGMKSPGN